ncbi:hypothetical protein T492DRAFT_1094522 [Pavlovales sp. CCMP2436]|nr:hypothetical protein T492DRAFT_1094522 [Pavlovales sp. CCMP2436]
MPQKNGKIMPPPVEARSRLRLCFLGSTSCIAAPAARPSAVGSRGPTRAGCAGPRPAAAARVPAPRSRTEVGGATPSGGAMTAETPKRVGSGLPRCGVRSSGATTIAGSPASCQLSTSACFQSSRATLGPSSPQ